MKRLLIEYIYTIYSLIVIFIFIRFAEYSYFLIENNVTLSLELLFGRSINFDSLFLVNFGLFLLVPTILTGIINKKTAMCFFKSIAIILLFIHLILTSYFLISGNILNSTVFEFSPSELSLILLSEFTGQNLIMFITSVFILFAAYYLFFKIIPGIRLNKKINTALAVLYLALSIVAIANRAHTSKSVKYFDNNFLYLLGNSKEVFYIKSIDFSGASNNFDKQKIEKATLFYHKATPYFNYCNNDYPFVHNEPYINVLGKYFKKDTTISPNIVIIISESLSSSFSGPNNSLHGSLTPFTDSLSLHSLYWCNFLSNAERSYGVLPNVLASLPTGAGKRGFINMNNKYTGFKKYPVHTGLIELLKHNNYTTNYFYGGWGYFDNVGYFIKESGIDNFISEDDFNDKVYRKPAGNMVWGYNDKDLFSQSFDILDEKKVSPPFLNIYQTLSLHSPFNLAENNYYTPDFLEKRIKKLHLDKNQLKKIPEKILASIFFSDDALQHFFNMMKKRKDFSNTIFIITGDHSIDLNISNNAFEKYRVPLIIYSGLLNTPGVFKGLCSHIDILPSIIALLQDNYGLKFSLPKHWIGQGLDTSKIFNANRNIPLVINSKILPQYISGYNAVINNNIVRFDSLFNIKEEFNEERKNNVKNLFENYSLLNKYVCLQNKIWSKENRCSTTSVKNSKQK